MKYTPSALVSEFSGKQGSTVASHNRFGPYFRNRTIPTNPNTASQQSARNDLVVATKAWQGLTDAQRAAWSAAASSVHLFDRLGRAYTPTGHQYFVSVNRTTFVYSGSTAITSAPPSAAVPAAILTATPTPSTIGPSFGVAYTATPLAAGTKLLIEATSQLSPGVSFVSRSRFRSILLTAAAAASPAAIITPYTAKFGALVAAKKIFVRLTVITSDGQRSAPITASAAVS